MGELRKGSGILIKNGLSLPVWFAMGPPKPTAAILCCCVEIFQLSFLLMLFWILLLRVENVSFGHHFGSARQIACLASRVLKIDFLSHGGKLLSCYKVPQ